MSGLHDSDRTEVPHDAHPVQVVRTVGNVAIALGAALSVLTIAVPWDGVPREWLALDLVIALAGVGFRIEAAIRDRPGP